jgi:hypothetical protein
MGALVLYSSSEFPSVGRRGTKASGLAPPASRLAPNPAARNLESQRNLWIISHLGVFHDSGTGPASRRA